MECFLYLSRDANKQFRSPRLFASLEKQSHPGADVETELFFILVLCVTETGSFAVAFIAIVTWPMIQDDFLTEF